MGLGLSWLRLGLVQRGGARGPYLGLSGSFDYYIDDANGNDSNDGSEGSPWRSLYKLDGTILTAGETTRVLIKQGVYDKSTDYANIDNDTGAAARLDVVCEPGCIFDGQAATAARAPTETSCFEVGGSQTWTCYLFGNGLTIRNYNYNVGDASPQAIGASGTCSIYGYDIEVYNCGDGISMHQATFGYFWDVKAWGCFKAPVANVNTSHFELTRGELTSQSGSSGDLLLLDASCTAEFNDVWFIPINSSDVAVKLTGSTCRRCRFGTDTQWVRLGTAVQGTTEIYDSYLHAFDDNANVGRIERCFGRLSFRYSPTMNSVITKSVFVNESAEPTARGIYYVNYAAGTGGVIEVSDTVFSDYAEVDYGFVGRETYLAGTTFDGVQVYDGAVLSSTLTTNATVTGTITSDPQIGSADSYLMSDYASAAGLAGFYPSEVVEMASPRTLPTFGAEKLINGDGAATTGWDYPKSGTTVSATGTRIRCTSDAGATTGVAQQIAGLTVGKKYRVDSYLDATNCNLMYLRVDTTSGLPGSLGNLTNLSGAAYWAGSFTATAETMYIGVVCTVTGATEYGEFSLSVKPAEWVAD